MSIVIRKSHDTLFGMEQSVSQMPIHLKIRARIRAAGYKQVAIAERMGVSKDWISERMRGKTDILAKELPAFAEALGCSPADFFDDVARPRSQAERAAQMVTDFDQAELRSRLARLQRVRAEIDALIQEEESA